MKHLTLLLIFLIISQFAIGLCSHKYREAKAPKKYTHVVAQLAYGLLGSLTGKDKTEEVNGCLPKSWKTTVAKGAANRTSEGAKERADEALSKVGQVMGYVCKYKGTVLKFFGRRRYSRNFFLQKSTSTLQKKGIFTKLKNAAKAAKARLESAKEAVNKLKDIKGTIDKFQSLSKLLIKSWKKFKGKSCKSGKMKKLIKKTWRKVKTFLKSGLKNILNVLLNNVLCPWEKAQKLFKHFLIGMHTKDPARKLFHFGSFFGKFLANVGSDNNSISSEEKNGSEEKKWEQRRKKG